MVKASFTWNDGIIKWFNGPEWDDVVEEEFNKAAGSIEAEAKETAPWEDRTGQAREGLHAEVTHREHEVAIELAHGVDYGFWLEVIQNGRFAVIGPTLERHGRRVSYNAIRRVRYARKGASFV